MYDYVIVGAGTAGCVLAHRLSADPSVNVLLLEAGGPDTRAEFHIPAAFSRLFQTEADWNYWTAPQEHLDGRSLYWPRGKVLGGSSSINAMIYIRGHRTDFDGWAAEGCRGWGYADVLPYFKRSEDNARGASAYHGVGGPLRVEDLRDPHPVSRAFVRAAEQAGVRPNDDFNGAEQEGAGLYQVNQKGGRRHSAAAAFLRPVRARRNLTVATGAHATRVLFEGTRAVGVAYRQDGAVLTARAAREVLLCGGAVNTPQLLMLSGVGPADALRRHGIAVVADRAGVGQNLQDHLIVGVRFALRQPTSLLRAEGALSVLRYVALRRGGLSSNIAEAGLFAHTRTGEPAPDLQFHVAPTLFYQHGLVRATTHGFSLGPTLVRPRSVGHLRLRSADPFEAPLIDPGYLADPADVQTLVEGVRLARQIAHQPALRVLAGDELTPGPAARTDAEIAAYVRQTCETLYHPVGTCRMGPDEDAVVDVRLRVQGVEGLRVVDASVMPRIPNGNTNAPVLMIAERAADWIAEDASGEPARSAGFAGDGAGKVGLEHTLDAAR
ncbi:MAG: GMC family oxidoreductase [Rubricoccaceae bacterium]